MIIILFVFTLRIYVPISHHTQLILSHSRYYIVSCSLINPLTSCHEKDVTSGHPASMVGVKLQCRLTEIRLDTCLWSFWYYVRFESTHANWYRWKFLRSSWDVAKASVKDKNCFHRKHPVSDSLSLSSPHTLLQDQLWFILTSQQLCVTSAASSLEVSVH